MRIKDLVVCCKVRSVYKYSVITSNGLCYITVNLGVISIETIGVTSFWFVAVYVHLLLPWL